MSATASLSTRKRKKVSRLSGLELRMALTALQSVKASLKELDDAAAAEPHATDDPQLQSDLVTIDSDFEEILDKMLEMMQSKLEGPQALSFSSVKFKHLAPLNITCFGKLHLKSGYQTRAAATDILGITEHWSSDGLCRHLTVLQKLVPKAAAARTWIDAFFFRAAAMSPPGQNLVLSLEQGVPATTMVPFSLTTAGRFIGYTAITANEIDAESFLENPTFDNLTKDDHTLFVSEARSKGRSLEDHLLQSVCEMYAGAKKLQKDVIRGAVTNGQDWIFIFLKMNADGNGGVYAYSKKFPVVSVAFTQDTIDKNWCATIAGIITDWIKNSNNDIGDDDWFTIKERQQGSSV